MHFRIVLVTSPPQKRRRDVEQFSAFRLGGEGRADTSVHNGLIQKSVDGEASDNLGCLYRKWASHPKLAQMEVIIATEPCFIMILQVTSSALSECRLDG